MAHNNKELLKVLFGILDDEDNDIYLHIDAKSSMDPEGLDKVLKYSRLHAFKRFRILWGDATQAACQMFLLRKAAEGCYDYYHLISGCDLPLMSAGELNRFFEKNKGKQFINFDSDGPSEHENCRYIHPMQPLLARIPDKRSPLASFLYHIDDVFVNRQKAKGKTTGLSRGANWADITHDLAVDFLSHEKELLRRIRFAFSADECILQTYCRDYAKEKWELYGTDHDYDGSNLRKVDWERSAGFSPYVWRIGDYDDLMSCGLLFARKFDWDTDHEIILKIRETLLNRNGERK